MVRVLVVFLAMDKVMMEMFCPSDTCVELPLDHVLHQVILGVGTPEAPHVRLMELDCNFTWFSGNVVIEGHTGIYDQNMYNIPSCIQMHYCH